MSNDSSSNVPPRGGGLSLYANLLEAGDKPKPTPATVTRAPVLFTKAGSGNTADGSTQPPEADAAKKPLNVSSLRFQPMKRPQPNQKPKIKHAFPKSIPQDPSSNGPAPEQKPKSPTHPAKSTLADWAADDDEGFYEPERRQRGGRKRRKKNHQREEMATNWDDIYDASRPNNYEEYRHSDEKVREVREWKDRLYAHRPPRQDVDDEESDADDRPMNRQFAPPGLSFAPPPASPPQEAAPPPPREPPASIPDDATGEDAYTRRLRMSQGLPAAPPPPPAEVPAAGTISRAPVRYNLPAAPAELPRSEDELAAALAAEEDLGSDEDAGDDHAPSKRPGQRGFAARLMSKYGWSKGQGLGADGTGILNALHVKVEKRKKRPDAEGGGYVDPGGRGRIVGGKKSAGGKAAEQGKFGAMSEVVVLRGMVDGMDVSAELAGDGGGLVQEIGEECGDKYGRVERVYIHQPPDGSSAVVFIKFTSALSALRAVNALEGRVFNGNVISAMFYDSERFDGGMFA